MLRRRVVCWWDWDVERAVRVCKREGRVWKRCVRLGVWGEGREGIEWRVERMVERRCSRWVLRAGVRFGGRERNSKEARRVCSMLGLHFGLWLGDINGFEIEKDEVAKGFRYDLDWYDLVVVGFTFVASGWKV